MYINCIISTYVNKVPNLETVITIQKTNPSIRTTDMIPPPPPNVMARLRKAIEDASISKNS